jgi:hypothetical protein
MKKSSLYATALLIVLVISGCAKPNRITVFKSPISGVFYTVETYYASGPVSDTTRVYAHLEHNGKEKRMLILDGENITIGKIIWNSAHVGTICLDGGITHTFQNEVTLIVGDTSETLRNHLREHCDSAAIAAPDGT